jgi:hypothetical protein
MEPSRPVPLAKLNSPSSQLADSASRKNSSLVRAILDRGGGHTFKCLIESDDGRPLAQAEPASDCTSRLTLATKLADLQHSKVAIALL